MTLRALPLASVLASILTLAACGSSPTAPDSASSALPAAGEIVGHITDSYTGKDLGGVVVTVTSATNSGKTATTDSTGSFRLTGLDLSGTTIVRATLSGYDPVTGSVSGTAANVLNLKLTPSTGAVTTESTTETIAPNGSACSGATGACKGYAVVSHAQGAWDVTLTWVDPGVTLGLELWQNNARLQSGIASGTRTLRLQATLPAGTYEVRVRYQTGTATTSFTLSGTRPS